MTARCSQVRAHPAYSVPMSNSSDPKALAAEAAAVIADLTGVAHHDIALTLGSGWGKAADALGETVAVIEADRVPGFHASAVPGHPGTLRSVRMANGKHALIIGARTHFYEGRGVRAVVHGVRTAAATGATRHGAHERCRWREPGVQARSARPHQRPHQPDGDVATRGRNLRRPHRSRTPLGCVTSLAT